MAATKNLVLGGSGMIGTHLCAYLSSIGEEVINLDLADGFDLRTDDLEVYKDVDFVWFLAWDVGGAKYLTDEKNLLNIIRNNTLICERSFSFLEKYNIPFVFASSQLADTNNTYGITKILGEEWSRLLGGKVVKFWNVYGWEEPSERSHVIPDITVNALRNGEINLMTTGEEKRQFIFASDCVRNLVKLRASDAKEFDLSSGEWVSILQVAQLIASKTGAIVTPGTIKGYQNIMDPTHNIEVFDTEVSIEQGVDIILEQAKAYLQAEAK